MKFDGPIEDKKKKVLGFGLFQFFTFSSISF